MATGKVLLAAYDRIDSRNELVLELRTVAGGLAWTHNGFRNSPVLPDTTAAEQYARLTGLVLRNRKADSH